MNARKEGATVKSSRSFEVLRTMFIVGFALQFIGHFLPIYRLKGETLRIWLSTGGSDRVLSFLDLHRWCFRLGLFGWGFYHTLIFCAWFAFAVLAISYPRRWVFITGGCFAIYLFLFDFVGPQNDEIQKALIWLVLFSVARAMALVGFWVEPPARALAAVQSAEADSVQVCTRD